MHAVGQFKHVLLGRIDGVDHQAVGVTDILDIAKDAALGQLLRGIGVKGEADAQRTGENRQCRAEIGAAVPHHGSEAQAHQYIGQNKDSRGEFAH